MMKKIVIAADHAGYEFKEFLKQNLPEYEFLDVGAHSYDKLDDFPDFAASMASAIKDGQAEMGVLICGSGIGMSIAINRNDFIRGALVHDSYTAKQSRMHNDANVIVLGGRVIGPEIALDCVRTFFETEFLGGKYQDRLNKIRSC